MSSVALFVNNNLLSEYQKYLAMSPIKGAITFPPFTPIFLIADFISTVALYVLVIVRAGLSFFKYPYAQQIIDVLRFVFLYVAFTYIVSTLWMGQLEKQIGFEYECFKSQVAIDFADYYLRNNALPETLAAFTTYKTNPANHAALIYSKQTSLATVLVVDEKENRIMEGYRLTGLSHATNPGYRNYFDTYNIYNSTICKGSLRIPDYDPRVKVGK